MSEFFQDLWMYMKERKKFWLAPLMLLMVMFGGLLVLAEGSVFAPFIYTLF